MCKRGRKIGHTVTKETREKISKTLSGRHCSPKTEFSKGVRPSGYEKIRYKKGKDNFNWKGGISPENIRLRHSIEYRLWREAVFARDNWTCVRCHKRGHSLHAHHIKLFSKYPELRFAIDNGKTLCKKCHKLEHKLLIGG